MLEEVRKCAEANDIKGLRYIFVDCLDVDPTFEKYKEDYEYCKDIPGMFDVHANLSEMILDPRRWNASYWNQLKLDLMKNFSKERFEHMIQVAKVVYAGKIERLISERQLVTDVQAKVTKTSTLLPKSVNVHSDRDIVIKNTIRENIGTTDLSEPKKLSDAELQERKLAEKKRELEEENRRFEAEQAEKIARREAKKREATKKRDVRTRNTVSKKVLGMVLGIIVIVIFILVKVMQ